MNTSPGRARCTIVDTFPAFLAYWREAEGEPPDERIDRWLSRYLADWPELAEKQLADYARQGLDWREVARHRIFPFLSRWLPAMTRARRNLLAVLGPVYRQAQGTVGLDFDAAFVIHVGIGSGAGWADTFGGAPAVLFGLENMAECGWTEPDTLGALAAHELGHLLHAESRRRRDLPPGDGPFWQLYEEGFAQCCEHLVMGGETWHMQAREDWLAWCRANRARLAADFLADAAAGKSANRWFGSWFAVEGRRQCGYFLGHEMVAGWQKDGGVAESALLPADEVPRRAAAALRSMAG